MAYFHCLIGGGSSGGGYELTVTCDADFAGTTITATDGVTTLTQTCPSASPYEVVFEIPNGGDWTISGVVSGQTVSTGVNIPTSASLVATVQQTVTIHSAKEDTITYTDIYGDTQTEVFAIGQTSKQITVDIEPNGSSITFTSGVAKNPSNLSNAYSKSVSITSNTTDVYVMPDGALYWYGNTCDGWTNDGYAYSGMNSGDLTFNTNNILMNIVTTSSQTLAISGITNAVDITDYDVLKVIAYKNNDTLISNLDLDIQSLSGNKYIGLYAQRYSNNYWDNAVCVGSNKNFSSGDILWTRDKDSNLNQYHTNPAYVYAVLLE